MRLIYKIETKDHFIIKISFLQPAHVHGYINIYIKNISAEEISLPFGQR